MNKMKIISWFILVLSVLGISGCINLPVPSYNTSVPQNITTEKQVRFALREALKRDGWQYHEVHGGLIQASKQIDEQSLSILVVYGYAGFSLEYESSQNMQYNQAKNTIANSYDKIVSKLNKLIIKILKNE